MTNGTVSCPFEGPCFARVMGTCRILNDTDFKGRACSFQKPPEPRMEAELSSMDKHNQIITLHVAGMSDYLIAQKVGFKVKTVRSILSKWKTEEEVE